VEAARRCLRWSDGSVTKKARDGIVSLLLLGKGNTFRLEPARIHITRSSVCYSPANLPLPSQLQTQRLLSAATLAELITGESADPSLTTETLQLRKVPFVGHISTIESVISFKGESSGLELVHCFQWPWSL